MAPTTVPSEELSRSYEMMTINKLLDEGSMQKFRAQIANLLLAHTRANGPESFSVPVLFEHYRFAYGDLLPRESSPLSQYLCFEKLLLSLHDDMLTIRCNATVTLSDRQLSLLSGSKPNPFSERSCNTTYLLEERAAMSAQYAQTKLADSRKSKETSNHVPSRRSTKVRNVHFLKKITQWEPWADESDLSSEAWPHRSQEGGFLEKNRESSLIVEDGPSVETATIDDWNDVMHYVHDSALRSMKAEDVPRILLLFFGRERFFAPSDCRKFVDNLPNSISTVNVRQIFDCSGSCTFLSLDRNYPGYLKNASAVENIEDGSFQPIADFVPDDYYGAPIKCTPIGVSLLELRLVVESENNHYRCSIRVLGRKRQVNVVQLHGEVELPMDAEAATKDTASGKGLIGQSSDESFALANGFDETFHMFESFETFSAGPTCGPTASVPMIVLPPHISSMFPFYADCLWSTPVWSPARPQHFLDERIFQFRLTPLMSKYEIEQQHKCCTKDFDSMEQKSKSELGERNLRRAGFVYRVGYQRDVIDEIFYTLRATRQYVLTGDAGSGKATACLIGVVLKAIADFNETFATELQNDLLPLSMEDRRQEAAIACLNTHFPRMAKLRTQYVVLALDDRRALELFIDAKKIAYGSGLSVVGLFDIPSELDPVQEQMLSFYARIGVTSIVVSTLRYFLKMLAAKQIELQCPLTLLIVDEHSFFEPQSGFVDRQLLVASLLSSADQLIVTSARSRKTIGESGLFGVVSPTGFTRLVWKELHAGRNTKESPLKIEHFTDGESKESRLEALIGVLKETDSASRTVVFVSNADEVRLMVSLLTQHLPASSPVIGITSKSSTRDWTHFRSGTTPIMIASEFECDPDTGGEPTSRFFEKFNTFVLDTPAKFKLHFVHFALPTARCVEIARSNGLMTPAVAVRLTEAAFLQRLNVADVLDEAETTIFFMDQIDWIFAGSLYKLLRKRRVVVPDWFIPVTVGYLDWLRANRVSRCAQSPLVGSD